MERTTRQRMIEDVTLLWTLNEVPERPKENAIDSRVNETRQLAPARERQLVDNLAFISACTDNMLQVMAVCIEESSDGQGMTIRLASNTGDLSQTVYNFGIIARTLERAASRVDSRVSVRRDLLRQILIMDKPRILSRLRSRHAVRTRKTSGKPALVDLLARSLSDPSIRSGEITKADLKRLRSHSNKMSEIFTKFEETYHSDAGPDMSIDTLADLLRFASEFDTKSLLIALHTATAIEPTTKNFLPAAINKLGRYYTIANDLIDAARSSRYTIFRHISVKALEEPTIDVSSFTDGLLGFEAVLKRNIGLPYQRGDWKRYSQSLKVASTKFQSRMSNYNTTWKIHAEIQLLFFYEHNPNIPHPRIICSSKDACYLCDLFIKFHGKFHIPRTHGRLYDKWLLPERSPLQPNPSLRLLSAIERFDASLKASIVQSLYNRQLAHPQPNESRLQLREPWSSASTLARVATPQLGPGSLNSVTNGILKDSGGSFGSPFPATTTEFPTSFTMESMSPAKRAIDTYDAAEGPKDERKTSVDMPSLKVRSLSRGNKIGCKLSTPASALIVCTEAMDFHISWEWGLGPRSLGHDETQGTRWIEAEWLAPNVGAAYSDRDIDCIDVDRIASGIDQIIDNVEAPGPRPLAITKGEHTVIIRWHHGDPDWG